MRNAIAEVLAVLFTIFVGAITLVMVTMAGAGADTVGGNETSPAEHIDQNTDLESVAFDHDEEEVTLTITSHSRQSLTISDAAGFWTHGEPEQRAVTLMPGETAEVTLSVSEHSGHYAVSIDTDETLHPVLLDEPDQDLSWIALLTSGEALAAGAFSAFSWFVLSGVYVLYIEGGAPEVA